MDNETMTAAMPVQTVPSASCAPQAPKTAIRAFDCVFAWIALVLGFLTVRFALFSPNGFVTTAVSLMIFAGGTAYVLVSGDRPTARQWLFGAVICVFSFVYSVTASVLLHVLCFIFLTAAQLWWLQAVAIKARFVTRYFFFDLLRTVFIQPFRDITSAPRAIKSSVKGSEKAAAVRNIIIGLVATIPLTAVVAVLLSDADSGVENMLLSFSGLITEDIASTIFRIILGIPTGFLIFAAFRAKEIQKLWPLPSDVYYHEKTSRLAKIPVSGVLAGVTPICVLYLMYIVSQANYFLSAFSGTLPENMMYSEYARRGFFELCAIAVINLAVILSVLAFTKKRDGKPSPALKIYTCILCGFTLFIISTAIAKMLMYIGEYGLTRLRLYTSWFMILLAVIFLVLIVRAFAPRFRTSAAISSAFIVLFGILCFSRPDALIAEYNISLYEQGTLERLDVDMLCRLSDDAYAVMLEHRDTMSAFPEFERFLSYREGDLAEQPMLTYNFSSQKVAGETIWKQQ